MKKEGAALKAARRALGASGKGAGACAMSRSGRSVKRAMAARAAMDRWLGMGYAELT